MFTLCTTFSPFLFRQTLNLLNSYAFLTISPVSYPRNRSERERERNEEKWRGERELLLGPNELVCFSFRWFVCVCVFHSFKMKMNVVTCPNFPWSNLHQLILFLSLSYRHCLLTGKERERESFLSHLIQLSHPHQTQSVFFQTFINFSSLSFFQLNSSNSWTI